MHGSTRQPRPMQHVAHPCTAGLWLHIRAYLRAGPRRHGCPWSRRRRDACSPACWRRTPLRTPAAPGRLPVRAWGPDVHSSRSSPPRPFPSPAPSAAVGPFHKGGLSPASKFVHNFLVAHEESPRTASPGVLSTPNIGFFISVQLNSGIDISFSKFDSQKVQIQNV